MSLYGVININMMNQFLFARGSQTATCFHEKDADFLRSNVSHFMDQRSKGQVSLISICQDIDEKTIQVPDLLLVQGQYLLPFPSWRYKWLDVIHKNIFWRNAQKSIILENTAYSC